MPGDIVLPDCCEREVMLLKFAVEPRWSELSESELKRTVRAVGYRKNE
jgi:hypothetical protein